MHNPFALVIFGATGDLAHHKLIPVLFSLFIKGQLPENFFIIGFARRDLTTEAFVASFADAYTHYPQWEAFSKHLVYHQGSFEDSSPYTALIDRLDTIDKESSSPCERIFYLATPPQNYEMILSFLFKNRQALSQQFKQNNRFGKLAIEKPFGKNLQTARMLDKKLAQEFKEWQVFRVDHYLGKETVQNIIVFRFANGIFEPIWNATYIDHIQITFAEEKGVGTRGKFFDGVGILRDVTQNHLLQLFAAIAMEQPANFSHKGVRDARANSIQAIRCLTLQDIATDVVRGQYAGYLQEKDVLPHSGTETFVAMKFFVDSPRFLGVPFYIRAGKMMSKDEVTISIVFKQTCHTLFREIGCPEEGNVLTFRIQPDEGITIKLVAKNPGSKLMLGTANMHFFYDEQFKNQGIEAYEKILLDIFQGDQMLFNRSDELESSWQFITTILEGWEKTHAPVFLYERGTKGPKQAEELIEKDGRKWI